MDKTNLRKYRNKIDKLDNKIFILIKKRTQIIKNLLLEKKFKNQIIDHNRINEILKRIKNKSIRNGIDPKLTRKIWKSMIWSYISFERTNFKKK
jgi:chorismate mutase|tara:strand:- start:1581 stop:1862 length:282 start_codon:yes stop_codon:yes gene_type:complete